MTAVERPAATDETREGGRACPRCGAHLAAEQDWCLSCGFAATTRVERPPDWRLPVAIVAAVLALATGALVVAFLGVAGDTERLARVPDATPAPTAAPGAAATPSPGTTPTPPATGEDEADPSATGTPEEPGATDGDDAAGDFPAWPENRAAWTVILHSASTREDAEARAQELQDGGTSVGLLRSDDYATLRPGYWVVFSGQYETLTAAEDAAEGLTAAADDAYPRLVEPR